MFAFFAITFIIILAAISPGPDFFLIVKNSLLHNRKAGLLTAAGVSSSLLIHSSYCIIGLGVLITQSPVLFDAIKYLGAAYLITIGVKCLLAKRTHANFSHFHHVAGTVKSSKLFMEGLLCNLLNPKAILFILAFFTLIIKPDTPWPSRIGYGLEISVIHLIWFSILAVIITHKNVKMHLDAAQYYIIKLMGIVLMSFGGYIALAKIAVI